MGWDERWLAGDTPWEKGRAAPPLLELLEERPDLLAGVKRILVPGCGSGHDVRALAAAGIQATGLDLSPAALRMAASLPQVAGEDYLQGDFLDLTLPAGVRYDAIWEHTCFCAIDPADRPRYALAAASILAPGGILAGVFFLNPWDPGEEEKGPPFGGTVAAVTALLAPWFDLEWEKMPRSAYPGREGREWLAIFRRRLEQRSCIGQDSGAA